jgi:hypothetical protein
MWLPRACAASSASSTAAGGGAVTSWRPGTTTVSASASASSPWSVAMRIGPALTTGAVPHALARFLRITSIWPLVVLSEPDDDGLAHAQFVLFGGFDPLDVIAPFEVTTPMRLNLAFDVVVDDDDRTTGHSEAGRLPHSDVTGVRRASRPMC